MMETRDEKTGELIFRVLKVGLACQSCQDLGLAAECTHMEQVSRVLFRYESIFRTPCTYSSPSLFDSSVRHGSLRLNSVS